MNKYYSRKNTVDGICFDSQREAQRYCELALLQRAGKITNLERQKTYELIPAQYETYPRLGKNGQKLKDGRRCIEKAVTYVADFVYLQGGQLIVEDAKGVRTPEYVIKRKLMLYVHGIKVTES